MADRRRLVAAALRAAVAAGSLAALLRGSAAVGQESDPTLPVIGEGVDPVEAAEREGRLLDALDALPSRNTTPAEAMTRARLLRGLCRFDEAERTLRAELASPTRATPQVRAALGALLVDLGRLDDAVAVLEPAAEGDGVDVAARYWHAVALAGLGRRSRARIEFEDIARLHGRGALTTANDLLIAARAWQGLERFGDANAAFRAAIDADPDAVTARLDWAQLFLQKYRADEAAALAAEALERRPADPDALATAALASLEVSRDTREAREFAERALAVCPSHPQAIDVLASLAIDDQEYDAALALIDTALEARPRRIESLALRGAVQFLRDDTNGYDATTREVLAIDPSAARYFHVVGELASRNFRYQEALALQQQALDTDAGFWPALVSIGIGFSRVGDDARALQFLRRAFEADPFNVQAYTMVELWEGALNDYHYEDDPEIAGLRYRFHRNESPVLSRYVPTAIRNAWRRYELRYGLTPAPPVSIEMFADGATFSIRSVGVPWAMQSGICFGHVVTARSPGEQPYNWQQTVEHELSHVFSLQVSRARVPRWFTEGLAEYDTILANDSWRRDDDLGVVRALQSDRLLGVDALNRAFVVFDRPEQVLEAYHQASLVVEFIGERWGYPALVAMLQGWGSSKPTDDVFGNVLGLSVEAFDAAFEEAMRTRFAALLGLLEPTPWTWALDDARVEADAHPNDPVALARLAWALLSEGDLAGATEAAARGSALDARQPLLLLFSARAASARGDHRAALAAYTSLFDSGADSVTGRVDAAAAARAAGDHAAARAHLESALALHASLPDAHRLLAELAEERGDVTAEAEHRERLARLDEHDLHARRWLLHHHADAGDAARAMEFGALAVQIDPFDTETHAAYGRAAHATGAWEAARRELELATADPRVASRPALLRLLADAYDGLELPELAARARREAGG